MKELKIHPAADAFPMMDKNRFKDLLGDIKECGQLVPITIYDGMILDGRNRLKACLELGVNPITEDYIGDPWAFVWSLNGQRRDIVDEHRYQIWLFCNKNSEIWRAEQERIKEEANRKRSEAMVGNDNAARDREEKTVDGHMDHPLIKPPSPERAAKAKASKTNVGAVKRGDKLAKDRPDLAEKVRKGEMKPRAAYRKMVKDAVADTVLDLPPGKYRVIYADPPWKYNDAQAVKGEYGTGTGAAEVHYPTMTMEELKALDVNSLAADDSVIFLWATAPLLENALSVCKEWGFKYKAQFIWDKIKHNMGHYNSVRHEILLICTKGSCTPENVKLYDSVQSIERTEHSRKPEKFREIIDTIYPNGPRVELFCRGQAPEPWVSWGNESIG